ncbi:MAG: VCBS repeat-containing protein, partial [Blastocatellia bacterium]|nr:VCBS repeat-containing protein [Blastocatellia bacterium]
MMKRFLSLFGLSALLFTSPAFGQSGGSFTITKSVIAGGGGSGSGGSFTLNGTIGQAAAGTTSTGGSFSLESGFWAGGNANVPQAPTQFDFDGDRKADFAVYRPAGGDWWRLNSGTNYATYSVTQFGINTDQIVPADYTGDG